MTPALQKIVEAMMAELQRQDQPFEGGTLSVDFDRNFPVVGVIGEIDVEKVARAGLAAAREPPADVIGEGAAEVARYWTDDDDAGRLVVFDGRGTYVGPADPSLYDPTEVSEGADRLNAAGAYRAMIDAILGEQP